MKLATGGLEKDITAMTLEDIATNVPLNPLDVDIRQVKGGVKLEMSTEGAQKVGKYYSSRLMICLLLFANVMLYLKGLAFSETFARFEDVTYFDVCKKDSCIKIPGTRLEMDTVPVGILSKYRTLQQFGFFEAFMAIRLHAQHDVCFVDSVNYYSSGPKRAFLVKDVDEMFADLRHCKALGAKFIVAPLVLTGAADAHANLLLYNATSSTLERFDPNGAVIYPSIPGVRRLDTYLTEMSKKNGITYDFHPAMNVQSSESHMTLGLCETWVFWYLQLRIANPGVNVDTVNRVLSKMEAKTLVASVVSYLEEAIVQYEKLYGVISAERLELDVYSRFEKNEPHITWSDFRQSVARNPFDFLMDFGEAKRAQAQTVEKLDKGSYKELPRHIKSLHSVLDSRTPRFSTYWKNMGEVPPSNSAG